MKVEDALAELDKIVPITWTDGYSEALATLRAHHQRVQAVVQEMRDVAEVSDLLCIGDWADRLEGQE